MSYISFNEINAPLRKTRVWEVWQNATDNVLGQIYFLGAWRKYIFAPNESTLYDASCLREIADFAEAQTKEWRESLAERPAPSVRGGKEHGK